jgi:OmpA-OmpF porin, OOP family
MIKMYKTFLALVFFATTLASQAQGPITVGVSSHFANFTTDNYFPPEYWQIGIAKLSLGIPLTNKITLSPSFAFGNASTQGSNNEKNAYWDFDFLSFQFALNERKLQPFISLGAGVNRFNKTIYGSYNGGLGLNYWISEKVALTAQTNYDATPSFVNYWHNSVGLTFKLKSGPKDSDKDGIPDVSDACPLEKGTAATNGCPDRDMDGIADKDDACPDVKGTVATKGCPDADADGIADAQDKCPNEAGKPENGGCPDTDGDGVIDKNDACPQVAGLSTLAGCPDGDGDGVADKDDACPTVKGPASNKGCPNDRDRDGVADEEDNCPDVAGVASNKGCPEIKEEEKKQLEKKLNMAAKLIQFETGSATIKAASYKELDEIVNIMNQYPASKFKVEGHTDNTGNAANNTTLSGKRADAVKAYIADKGINESRLSAEGFGSSRPIGANTTAAGRAQNRRVEIHLME